MFIRVIRPSEGKEILLNVDHIIKIEVEYVVEGKEHEHWKVSVMDGLQNPDAKRWYKVHVGGEVINLLADSNDPVRQVIEDIYKAAIKG